MLKKKNGSTIDELEEFGWVLSLRFYPKIHKDDDDAQLLQVLKKNCPLGLHFSVKTTFNHPTNIASVHLVTGCTPVTKMPLMA